MGGDGHIRIAGLGTAFIPPTVPAVDVDRSSRDAASELIDARVADTEASMTGDVYAFSVLAWEVRVKMVTSLDKPLNWIGFVGRFSLGNLRSQTRALSQELIQW